MWPDLIGKAKAGGLDAIESFVFWNLHEPKKREVSPRGGRSSLIKQLNLP